MKNQKFFMLLLISFSFSLVAFSQLPGGGLEHEQDGDPRGGDCDYTEVGLFNHLSVAGEEGVIELSGSTKGGWNNQIRFYSDCGEEGALHHVIASHEGRQRLVIAPGLFGTVDDVMEVHGRISLGTIQAPNTLQSGVLLDGYRLFVNGGILAEEIRVATGWADYVFYDDYRLLKLSEVRTYIDTNGHLPDVSSAEEIEINGMDVGEITVQQQVKIEELFLYILDMEERLSKLETENKRLKKT